jgi:hypothetical protein
VRAASHDPIRRLNKRGFSGSRWIIETKKAGSTFTVNPVHSTLINQGIITKKSDKILFLFFDSRYYKNQKRLPTILTTVIENYLSSNKAWRLLLWVFSVSYLEN